MEMRCNHIPADGLKVALENWACLFLLALCPEAIVAILFKDWSGHERTRGVNRFSWKSNLHGNDCPPASEMAWWEELPG